MQFTIKNQEELTKKLALNMKAVSSSRLIQSLRNFKLDVKKDVLEITSYNGESCIISTSDIINNTQEECTFLVEANIFKSVIDKFIELKADKINIFVDFNNSKICLNCRGIEFYLNITKNIEGFEGIPTIETYENYDTAIFNKIQLKRAFLNTQKCTSKDQTRPILAAINLHKNEGVAEVIALDGFRFAHNKITCESNATFKISLSSVNTMPIVYDILKDGYDFVEINSNGVYTMIENNDTVVFLKQVVGILPDYKKILLKNEESTLLIDKKMFESALQATRIGNHGSIITELIINPKTNSFTVKSSSVLGVSENVVDGCAISVEADIDFVQDDEISIFFNNLYLIDLLQSIYTERCKLVVQGKTKPMFIHNENDNNATYLLSPVSVK